MTSPLRRSLLAAVALLGTSALAYILPASSILRRVAEGRDELSFNSLKVDGSLTLYGAAAQEAAAGLGLPADKTELLTEAAILLKVPGRCRFEAQSIDTGKVSAAVDARGRRRTDGSSIGVLAVALAQVCPLLGSRGADNETRATLERHLANLRVEPRRTSLSRFGGQVAYVLGESAEGRPQFWVYKDTFRPARVKLTEAGADYDVRFLDYTGPATGELFPRVVEVARGNELLLRFVALKGDPKAKLDDRLF